ncbi:hypothetical protein BZA05DRAFT_380950 [Tricharina praecox]|uniref:uncharacterized protein n=1 Tax=Tricharina praecox TaxID=43433 RepID=UPI00221FD681|nr:uncharacterized protein BZA05DRAFT_380950 [Tricharina praecox]KAI5858358.1 hypothetical protein BZA05DRAFT_380950 [Tricharina praecox]
MATTAGIAAAVVPGKALGFIALGSSLHYVLARLRSYEKAFTSISTIYDPISPLSSPVVILLENNGIRLRFDGADQRLRLIEVLDFQKCGLTYNNREIVKPGAGGGPTFKGIYNKSFGPTYPGEYVESQGLYVLSYPGVAFSFPIDRIAWKEDVDFVSLLSSTNAQPATSMAIFAGPSWADVRDDLFTRPVQNPRTPSINGSNARLSSANDEVEFIRIHDGNAIEIIRRHNPPFWITLHSTTPQDLVSELGPPDVIYRKSDHRLSIHRTRHDDIDSTEEDTPSDDDDSDLSDLSSTSNGDCFYNYFVHGIDIFISSVRSSSNPVATKVIIHGNVPGSYEFQRYRRCRWAVELSPLSPPKSTMDLHVDSEQSFDDVLVQLHGRFGGAQKPMPLNRGSDSPSSSCELLGGWEDGDTATGAKVPPGTNETTYGNTELYGFPGFIFEVLKNKSISCLTVF